jgi:hypothetical protein
MHRLALITALLLPTSALARDLMLSHQLRLLDATGLPIEGEVPLTVALHTDATADTPLWSVDLIPTFSGGYASVLLDVGEGAAPIDSEWFESAVWLELTVNSETQSPRSRVADVPVHIPDPVVLPGPVLKQIYVHGTNWSTQNIVLHSSASIDANGLTFNAGGPNDELMRWELASDGEFPNGVKVEMDFTYERLTSDADPTFFLTDWDDDGPEFCGFRVLDQLQMDAWVGAGGAYPGTSVQQSGGGGSENTSNNPAIVHATWIMPPGASENRGSMSATVDERRISAPCPPNVHVDRGIFLNLSRNNAGERYRIDNMSVTLIPL